MCKVTAIVSPLRERVTGSTFRVVKSQPSPKIVTFSQARSHSVLQSWIEQNVSAWYEYAVEWENAFVVWFFYSKKFWQQSEKWITMTDDREQ